LTCSPVVLMLYENMVVHRPGSTIKKSSKNVGKHFQLVLQQSGQMQNITQIKYQIKIVILLLSIAFTVGIIVPILEISWALSERVWGL